jgi:hypothetical protein
MSSRPAKPETPSKQLAAFIAKFDPAVAAKISRARKTLRALFPSAHELVYDNYNFFVIGYCTTERPSDCMVSLVADRKGLALSFYYGSTLPDPRGILQGSGSQNRFIRLESADDLAKPEVAEMLQIAADHARTPLPESGKGNLIIRSVSAKQRPRR